MDSGLRRVIACDSQLLYPVGILDHYAFSISVFHSLVFQDSGRQDIGGCFPISGFYFGAGFCGGLCTGYKTPDFGKVFCHTRVLKPF
jgi:hypothetical protein